jgi:hypothetical protein
MFIFLHLEVEDVKLKTAKSAIPQIDYFGGAKNVGNCFFGIESYIPGKNCRLQKAVNPPKRFLKS